MHVEFLALLSAPAQDAGLPFDSISAGEVSGHPNVQEVV